MQCLVLNGRLPIRFNRAHQATHHRDKISFSQSTNVCTHTYENGNNDNIDKDSFCPYLLPQVSEAFFVDNLHEQTYQQRIGETLCDVRDFALYHAGFRYALLIRCLNVLNTLYTRTWLTNWSTWTTPTNPSVFVTCDTKNTNSDVKQSKSTMQHNRVRYTQEHCTFVSASPRVSRSSRAVEAMCRRSDVALVSEWSKRQNTMDDSRSPWWIPYPNTDCLMASYTPLKMKMNDSSMYPAHVSRYASETSYVSTCSSTAPVGFHTDPVVFTPYGAANWR